MTLKHHGFCQYPGCNLDLGEVHIAIKFCRPHAEQSRREKAVIHRRENYRSKYHREKTISKEFRLPRPLPAGIKDGGPCPGNGNGYCGKILHREIAFETEGYSTNFYDYFCGTHRFPVVVEEEKGGK
jgi:hypothetical protein